MDETPRRRIADSIRIPVTSYDVERAREALRQYQGLFRHKDDRRFYTFPTIAEFVQLEIDRASQTLTHQLHVQPSCLVSVGVAGTEKYPGAEEEVLYNVGTGILNASKRRLDRLGRHKENFILLLNITMPRDVRDHYVGKVETCVRHETEGTGTPVDLYFGICGIGDGVRDPIDMLEKATGAMKRAMVRSPWSAELYSAPSR